MSYLKRLEKVFHVDQFIESELVDKVYYAEEDDVVGYVPRACLVIKYADGTVDKSYNVTVVDGRYVTNSSNITYVKVPNGATMVGSGTFASCRNLVQVTLPNTLASLGMAAFNNCTSLEEINLPESLTDIGGYAFQNCTSLTSVV